MKPVDTSAIAYVIASIAEESGRAAMVGLANAAARSVIRTFEAQCRAQNVRLTMNVSDNLGASLAELVHPKLVKVLGEVEEMLRRAPLSPRLLLKL